MLEMFVNAGPFAYVVTCFGLTALALNVLGLVRRGGRDLTGLALGFAAASLLAGICGTGAGLAMAGQALSTVEAEAIPRLFATAVGIASTTTAFGALWAMLNAILCGVGRTVRAA